MKTIVLPGFSPSNRDWAYEIKEKISSKEIFVHEWRHWEADLKSLALMTELENIKKEIGDSKVNIIAKSVGTRVCVNLLLDQEINIDKIILCGIPLRGFGKKTKDLFIGVLKTIPNNRIVCFQNENDPWGKYILVDKFMKGINTKIKVYKMNRSDHHYPYYKDFEKFLNK